MKNIYKLLTSLLLLTATNAYAQLPSINFCDNFDSYVGGLPPFAAGDPIAETSPNWNSWAELLSGATAPFSDDCEVSATEYYSAPNCLYFIDQTGTGGPQDILLMFDNTPNITQSNINTLITPYISGVLTYSHMMKVVSGKTGYFNFQAENTPGVQWALEVNLDATGGMVMTNTSGTNFSATYPNGQWFELKFVIDLSMNNWEVFVDNVSQGSFANTINQVSSIDLYTNANSEFWIDDVCYDYQPAILDPLNAQLAGIDAIAGLAGQQREPIVDIRNFGQNPITSFDVTVDYNGSQVTENVTGLNLTSLQTYQVNFSNQITLATGTLPVTAFVHNINGGMTQNTNDDTLSITATGTYAAPGKIVVGEEGTGTWCGWCPRGSVAMNWMDEKYYGYWQGIAVHNGDVMTDTDYDVGLGGLISGYPSGLVDRGSDIDPADFEIDFLQRIGLTPKATMVAGAYIDGNTMKVSLTMSVNQTIGANHKLACVLVEDSVTGTGPNYYQANYYSGGANGSLVDVDGTDWKNKPSNVPDYMMVYRHVARGIAPNFNGQILPQMYQTGDTETICFEFNIDPSWDLNQMHIVGMLIDNTGRVNNGSSQSYAEALSFGWVDCSSSTEAINLEGPEHNNIQAYPNPANNTLYIDNLPEDVNSIKIFNIEGKLVLDAAINNILDISKIKEGLYQLKITTKDNLEINRKIIKN